MQLDASLPGDSGIPGNAIRQAGLDHLITVDWNVMIFHSPALPKM